MALCDKIDSARLKACIDSTGGISKIYIANFVDIISYTIGTTGSDLNKVTAINMVPGTNFYEYDFGKNTGEVNDNWTKSEENGTAGHVTELKARFFKNTQPNFDQLQSLFNNDMAIVFKDLNDLYWVLGEKRGVNTTVSATTWGKLVNDFNGSDVTLVAQEKSFPRELSSSVNIEDFLSRFIISEEDDLIISEIDEYFIEE